MSPSRVRTCVALLTTGLLAAAIGLTTGPLGPTTATAAAPPGTYGDDGGAQTWTVPAGVIRLGITATGGSGSDGTTGSTGGSGGAGGKGALVTEVIDVTPGDRIEIVPGGSGEHSALGDQTFAGGVVVSYANAGGRGGNATIVKRNGHLVLVAGGGGGGGAASRLLASGWNGGAGGAGGGYWGTAGDGTIAGESGHGLIPGAPDGVGGRSGAEASQSPGGGGGSGGGGFDPSTGAGGGLGGDGGNYPGGAGGGGAGGASWGIDPTVSYAVAPVYGDGSVSLSARPHEALTVSATPSLTTSPSVVTDTLTSPVDGGPTPTGTVTFGLLNLDTQAVDHSTTVPVTGGVATWTLPAGLPVGTVYVVTTYHGDDHYLPDSVFGYAVPVAAPTPVHQLTITPVTTADFGTVVFGTTATRDFVVHNTGTFPESLERNNLSHLNSGTSSVGECWSVPPTVLSPGASCTMTLSFVPLDLGPVQFTLQVGNADTTASLLVTGDVLGAVLTGPANVDLGATPAGIPTTTRTITVTNQGTYRADITVTPHDPAFAYTPHGCTGVAPGGTCTIDIVYTPAAGAPVGTVATLPSIGAPTARILYLPAVTAAVVAPIHQLTIAPVTSADFGNVDFYRGVATRDFVVRNTGNVPETLDILRMGEKSGWVPVGGGCWDYPTPNVLAAGASCTMTLSFRAVIFGAAQQTFEIGNADAIASLTLTANVPGAVLTGPANIDLGGTTAGIPTAARTVTVTNQGTNAADLTVTSHDPTFTYTPHACKALAPGATCTIDVVYTPAVGAPVGNVTDRPDIGAWSASTHYSPTVTAAVVNPPVVSITVDPVAFGNVTVGTSATRTATVHNTGSVAVSTAASIVAAPSSAGLSVAPGTCTGTLAAGSTCGVTVTFAPTTPGARTTTLSVVPRVGTTSSPAVTAAVTGTAVAAPAPAPTPVVRTVAPARGPVAGGTTVTITGDHLTGATGVLFGSTRVAVTCTSATRCTAVSPAGTGRVDVRVVSPAGTSRVSDNDRFTFR